MDSEHVDMCTERLFYERCRGTDPRTGALLYDDPPNPIPVHGKVEQFVRVVTDSQKRTVTSNTRVFLLPQDDLGGDLEVTTNDRLTLPAGYTPSQPPILNVQRENDPEDGGVYCWVVSL